MATTGGLTFAAGEFEEHVIEEQVPHSTALHARLAGRGRYLVGPRPDTHSTPAVALAAGPPGRRRGWARRRVPQPVPQHPRPRRRDRVRGRGGAAAHRAVRAARPCHVDVPPRAGIGFGATEAPRGVLFHRYALDADGLITAARIVPPTSQNQASIEDDLRRFVAGRLDLDDERLTWQCEQAIRNYDPCISCSTHFLDLTVDRA